MRRSLRIATALTTATVLAGGLATSALADPPGANGTVKVDGRAFDTLPNNQPKVGCEFEIDFYGFDKGNFVATVLFEAKPPSGTSLLRLDEGRVFIGEDRAGGGTDLDAEAFYDLSSEIAASGITAHPKQGYHVKVTVSAPGVNGKIAKKSKVFWVKGCDTVDYPDTPDYP